MKRGEKYIIDVAPELDASSAQDWIRSLNVLLKSTMIYSLNLEMNSALKVVMNLAGDIISYSKAIFYFLEEDGRQYYPVLTNGFTEPLPQALNTGNIILDWTIESKQPVGIDEADSVDLERLMSLVGCRSAVSIPILVEGKVLGVLQLFSITTQHFSKETVRLLWILTMQMEGLFHRMQQNAYAPSPGRETIEGLPDRPLFEANLEKELVRSRRSKRPFGVLLVEIDHLDHQTKDFMSLEVDLLVNEVISIINSVKRSIDFVARFSESSIAMVLSEADEKSSYLFANRINSAVNAANLTGSSDQAGTRVTISTGVASFPKLLTVPDLLLGCEYALQAARDAGGDRVETYKAPGVEREKEPVALDAYDLLDTIGNFFDIDILIKQLVEFFSRLSGAQRVSILVSDELNERLLFKHGIGFQGFEDDVRSISIDPEASISGKVMKSRRPLIISDIDQAIPDRPRRKLNYTSPSFISIPLIHNGQEIGVINFSNKEGGTAFNQDDLHKLIPHTRIIAKLLAEGRRFTAAQSEFFTSTAEALLGIAESKSPYLAGHSERVSGLAFGLAKQMNFSEVEAKVMGDSGKYHDLGRIAVDENMLSKEGPLEDSERVIVNQHPLWSSRILETIPGLSVDLEAIKCHHEHFDGKGYPGGLMGEEIPLGGRILAVADAYDAMTTDRPFRTAMTHEEAISVLDQKSGNQFDTKVVEAFKKIDIEH